MTKIPISFHKPEDIIRFVDIVNHYDYTIQLVSGNSVVDAKSIIGAFTVGSADDLKVQVQDRECQDLLENLAEYVCE